MIDTKVYLNKEVSKITGLTQRQVLNWTEKGLVAPFKESTGVGTKRCYNYTNLLEFGLCHTLFSVGMGIRSIKNILGELRRSGALASWADNFINYYETVFEEQKAHFDRFLEENKPNDTYLSLNLEEFKGRFLQKPFLPENPIGVLFYFFSGGEGENVFIIPWAMDYVINLNMIRERLIENEVGLLIDIGKIKKRIDRRL